MDILHILTKIGCIIRALHFSFYCFNQTLTILVCHTFYNYNSKINAVITNSTSCKHHNHNSLTLHQLKLALSSNNRLITNQNMIKWRRAHRKKPWEMQTVLKIRVLLAMTQNREDIALRSRYTTTTSST